MRGLKSICYLPEFQSCNLHQLIDSIPDTKATFPYDPEEQTLYSIIFNNMGYFDINYASRLGEENARNRFYEFTEMPRRKIDIDPWLILNKFTISFFFKFFLKILQHSRIKVSLINPTPTFYFDLLLYKQLLLFFDYIICLIIYNLILVVFFK